MTTLCIQVQPDRAPVLDMERVRSLCRLVTSDRSLTKRHGIVEGVAVARYVNLLFDTARPSELWDMLKSVFYEDTMVGPDLANTSLTLCEGDRGWDDCLVLHHFDPEVEIDEI